MGQGLLFVGTWRLMFDLLLVAGIIVALWAGLRLPETMRAACGAQPLPFGASIRLAVETPQTIGYAVSGGLMFGCVLGYVSSAQQVFVDVFDLGARFPLAFGATALMMALASLTNAQLVERLGMRRLSHTALAAFIALSAVLAAGGAARRDASFWLFIGLMVPLFYLFGLIAPNFNALAMEPQGDNAGMASSVIGFVSTGHRRAGGRHRRSHVRRHGAAAGARLLRPQRAVFAVVVWVEGRARRVSPGALAGGSGAHISVPRSITASGPHITPRADEVFARRGLSAWGLIVIAPVVSIYTLYCSSLVGAS